MFNTTVNLVFSIAPQTQEFLAGLLRIYTPADVKAVNDLAAQINASKVRLKTIDSKTPTTGMQ